MTLPALFFGALALAFVIIVLLTTPDPEQPDKDQP